MKHLVIFACGVFLALKPFAAPDRPNIVLILADDMGYGEPSHAGGLIPTPALDQLASEGMRFTDAHTSSSVCTPTRYGILTGRYNWRSRLKRGVLVQTPDHALMDPERLTLPRYLQQAGYHTGCVGKWHLGVDWEMLPENQIPPQADNGKTFGSWKVDYTQPFRNGPVDVGFEEAFFILGSLDMPPYLYLRNKRAESVPTVNRFFPHNEYNDYHRLGAGTPEFEASHCLADWARESRSFINKQAAPAKNGSPFFLYLALSSPHTPVAPGKAFAGRYPQYSSYADFIAETDWVVGQVLEELKASGLAENTLLLFTSDNGFAPYVEIPKMLNAGYKPSGPFRGSKASIYEGGHRVPFLVRWPGKVAPGSSSGATLCTTDFYATFAEVLDQAASLPPDAAEDSFSFFPHLIGQAEAPVRPYTIHHSISGVFAIRQGPWKLILGTNGGGGWGPGKKTPAKVVQLYHLGEDPAETTNLEDQHPEKVQELVDLLAEAIRKGRTTPGPDQTNEGWPSTFNKEILAAYPQLKGS